MSEITVRACVVIPAYNEAKIIAQVIRKSQKIFTRSAYNIDIVVVNDGSSDNTSAIAKTTGVTVIDHILNSGAGGATATGLSYADQMGYDIAATMDADGQHNPKDIIRGIETLLATEADLMIGSRLINPLGMTQTKIIGNVGLSAVTFLLFGVRSTDSQSGLRIYSKRALKQLHWKTRGYEFCSEMLWRAKQAGLVVKDYPIETIYTDYSRQKGQNNWNGINIIKSLLLRRIAEMFG